jgi:DNA processing protein
MDSRVRSDRVPFEAAQDDFAESDEGARRSVDELLGPSPVPVDELMRLSGLPSGAVQMVLLELDLAGRLDRHAGGKVSLR